MWLVIQGRIQTKNRLAKFQKLPNTICVLCGLEEEDIQHLFFACEITQQCLIALKRWLGWKTLKIDLGELLNWI